MQNKLYGPEVCILSRTIQDTEVRTYQQYQLLLLATDVFQDFVPSRPRYDFGCNCLHLMPGQDHCNC